jgi:hypothetical protein
MKHATILAALAALAWSFAPAAEAGSRGVGNNNPASSASETVTVDPTTGIPANVDGAGNQLVNCAVGCSSTSDSHSGTATITAADVGTTTVAGQSGVTLVVGTPTANSFQRYALNGNSSATITVTGTFTATLAIETSSDGVTYGPASGKILGSSLTANSITAPGVFRVDVTGMQYLRVRATAYTSAPTLYVTGSAAAGLTQVINPLRLTDASGNAATITTGGALNTAAAISPLGTNPTSTLTLTSTTSAYSSGQLVASSATAGSVVVPSFAIATSAGSAAISRLRLATNDSTSTAWGAVTLAIDLWSAAPTFTNGDRGAFAVATGTAGHLGTYSCTMSAEYGDGAYAECGPAVGTYSLPKLASGTSVFWTLRTTAASGTTGASKVWTLTAELLN